MAIYENTEQDVLDRVTLRPIQEHEKPLWNRLIEEEHYLHNATLVGEQIRYVAEYEDDWIALIGWSGAAYHIEGRDRLIGWSDSQRRNRLHFLVSNSRFLLRMERGECPNLASKVLKLCLDRLERDWRERYGHGILFAETFVDLVAYAGTCYKASNWIELGKTKGFERSGVDYYEAHDQPKRLFVRPLRSDACELLRSEELPEPWRAWERSFHPGCAVKVPKLRGLFDHFQSMPDPRAAHGRRYPLGCLLSIAACAVLAGAQGYEAIADFAEHLTQPQRRALRCWKNYKGVYTAPSVTTFSSLLNRLDNDALDQVVCTALRELEGSGAEAIAVDGKTVRSTRPAPDQESKLVLFSALSHDRAVVGNQVKVADKSNEIPALPELLKPLDLDGCLVSADALHTQRESARHIVQDKGADYLFTVKDNQPELKKRIEAQFKGRFFSLGPSHGR
ncbi:MAG: ISAs1 family transposase [Verrucomicrobia bacterium]|nr:ISAs1 family transposase [Verrucomicrobiota bacterium]MCH8514680.1 ISAs1 family transposase [Kiritimatiellia bacterium]